MDGPPECRQGVHQPGGRIDEVGVVVLPAVLVLLRPTVMVQREQLATHGLGSRPQIAGRLPAIAPDLQPWPVGSVSTHFGGMVEQGLPLVGGHETRGGGGMGQYLGRPAFRISHRGLARLLRWPHPCLPR